MLKLNDDKTEIIHLSSRFRSSMPLEFVNVGQSNIVPASYARNIGVTIDKHLTLLRHLTGMCQKASLALRNIGRIRRYLDQNCTEKLVHAYVTSRLDYCNSLLSGLPSASLAKLQRLQNAAARLVTLSKKHEHITPVLRALHWLPVRQRIVFKILLLTFKAMTGSAPDYITDLIHHHKPVRQLRSSSQGLLDIPPYCTEFYGARAFSTTAPKLWNKLPPSIRNSSSTSSFKRALKTYLFKEAYM